MQLICSCACNEGIEVETLRISLKRKLGGIQLDDSLAITLNDALHSPTRCNGDGEFWDAGRDIEILRVGRRHWKRDGRRGSGHHDGPDGILKLRKESGINRRVGWQDKCTYDVKVCWLWDGVWAFSRGRVGTRPHNDLVLLNRGILSSLKGSGIILG